MPRFLPGTFTFLFTDVEASTQLWERFPESMRAALAAHDAVLKSVIEAQRGQVVKTTGDGVLAVFSSAVDGVQAALAAQRVLRTQEPSTDSAPRIRVRMGLHSGEAQARDGDYFGGTLNRAARLMAIGHGGQILLSSVTTALVRDRLPEGASLRDLGEQRLKDLTQPERVYQLSVADLAQEFPALKSLSAYRHNLPIQLTSFVGRSAELAEVTKLLHDTRLLTLIGPGGTGKTRLSLQAAAELLDDFPDGVWFVELAPVTDSAQVEQAIASAFGVHEEPGVTLARALEDYVRYKQMLVVLDNCEHLIGAAAQAAQNLLLAGSQVKIVSSSREGLAIAGETIYQVPSLGLPPDGMVSPNELLAYGAIRLFVERAQAVLPSFVLTPENAEAVCEICRRLDGIPLAIELAAVRVRLLTPVQIAARLREHFRLLAGGSRTAMPRQQTLQALIDWSWNLLNDAERAMLRRLSVFAGGWTLDAAEAVCREPSTVNGEAAPTVDSSRFTDDVLDLLGQLVNKSLVVVHQEGESSRYRLLETVRQYARDKLLAAGESAAVHERHARYFFNLAREYDFHIYGRDVSDWLNRSDAELENFGSAYEWLAESDPLSALQLTNASAHAYQRRWRTIMLDGQLTDAIERVRRLPPPATVERQIAFANGLTYLATTCLSRGENQRGHRAAQEAVQRARLTADPSALSFALSILSIFDLQTGNFAASEAELNEAVELGRTTGPSERFAGGWRIAIALSAQAALRALRDGDAPSVRALSDEAMGRAQASGNPWVMGMAAMNASRAATFVGDLPRARALIEQAMADFERSGDGGLSRAPVADLGHILRRMGLRDEARAAYRESIRWFQDAGNRGGLAHLFECFAMLDLDAGWPERSASLFGAARRLRDEADAPLMQYERAEYDAAQARLRAVMDPVALERAWQAGARLSIKEAIALAVA